MTKPYFQFIIYWGTISLLLACTGLYNGIIFHKMNLCLLWGNEGANDFLRNGRGKNLFLNGVFPGGPDFEFLERLKCNCMVTGWNGSHFLVHFISGFLFPTMISESILLGIGFEFYEYHKLDCHDMMDIILNIIGVILGASVARIRLPVVSKEPNILQA